MGNRILPEGMSAANLLDIISETERRVTKIVRDPEFQEKLEASLEPLVSAIDAVFSTLAQAFAALNMPQITREFSVLVPHKDPKIDPIKANLEIVSFPNDFPTFRLMLTIGSNVVYFQTSDDITKWESVISGKKVSANFTTWESAISGKTVSASLVELVILKQMPLDQLLGYAFDDLSTQLIESLKPELAELAIALIAHEGFLKNQLQEFAPAV